MFWFSSKKKIKELEEKTFQAFNSVKKDMDVVGKWVKHLDKQDKQVFDLISAIQQDLSSVRDEIESIKEGVGILNAQQENKQVFKKLPVLNKQTPVEEVQNTVQTAVQTDEIYELLKKLSSNERLVLFTILNNEMKLSYEDLSLLLGKERSTIRGQINSIKQKSEGLIQEITEKNGKKRVFIPEEIKKNMQKYAKVRVIKRRKVEEK